jgi:hypothetical protein
MDNICKECKLERYCTPEQKSKVQELTEVCDDFIEKEYTPDDEDDRTELLRYGNPTWTRK